nr:putative transmembrane protein (PGPGW) [uncultured bacterium]
MDWLVEIWDWVVRFWQTITWSQIIWTAVFTVVTIIISYVAIVIGIIKIPADYFSSNYAREIKSDKHFSIRWTALIVKNIIGFLMILAGIVMLFTPGPGVPTILLGLIMLDIPGKRPLEARIIKRPTILAAINKLRARFDKPPLVLD